MIVRLLSLLILFSVLLLGLSLFTYSFSDISLNNFSTFSTDSESYLFRNWLGYGGAIVSDLLLQTLGLASFLMLLFPLGWSWRLYKDGYIESFSWRLTAVPLTLLLMSFVLEGIDYSLSFPELPNSSGGMVGFYISSLSSDIREGMNDNYIKIFLLLVSLCGILYVLAITMREWLILLEFLLQRLMILLSYTGRHLMLSILWIVDLIGRGIKKSGSTSPVGHDRLGGEVPDIPKLVRDDEETFSSDENKVLEQDFASVEGVRDEAIGEDTPDVHEHVNERVSEFEENTPHVNTETLDTEQDNRDNRLAEESLKTEVKSFLVKILGNKDKDSQESETPTIENSLETRDLSGGDSVSSGDGIGTRDLSGDDSVSSLFISDGEKYKLPSLSLLKESTLDDLKTLEDKEYSRERSEQLVKVLGEFGVHGEICSEPSSGPVVTLYEFKPGPGVRARRVTDLAEDIARSISVESVRVATMPGRNSIAVEIPNDKRQLVKISSLLRSREYIESEMKLPLILGCNIGGGAEIADLATMPHLLIAGTTGSGKSVGLNVIIMSLLYRYTPDECKFIMIDPKMLELSIYKDIPHLLTPVVTDPKQAVVALKWAVKEMENRYYKMSQIGVRNVDGYNKRVKDLDNRPFVKRTTEGFDENGERMEKEEIIDLEYLPYVVVIVDEMADLMLVAGKEIESLIQRLAQMARAAGIHIVMATQRPSVDVITGTIKANFPTRISFMVSSKIDSRTVLGEQGAEQLLGKGDMLFMSGGGKTRRIHGPFVEDGEVESVCDYLRKQGLPNYQKMQVEDNSDKDIGQAGELAKDELFDQAVSIIMTNQRASTSLLQRHLQIGYNRAARVMDQLESEGVVSSPDNSGKREVLIRNSEQDNV